MARIDKILIANRGEIACRVMRTAKRLGIATVAVYSEPDAGAPHMRLADEAVLIGPGPVGESYLCADKIIAAAQQTGADAIHPGYGFLSENATFAEAVEQAGLVFIGPSAKAIELMGNKAAAKKLMLEAGIPCVPGYQDKDQSEKVMVKEAEKIGFPIMVKAAAGGGGRGMRLVADADGLEDALALARSEAENAFGSGELILEKAIQQPRHVEIQVFADTHGHVIHLGERDCSVQRRHQKVIEEAPCPVMTPELRAFMGEAAVNAAKAIDYRGAGTVEFLLDEEGSFYFLEMNTRLQVEHPVTEEVTGLDLVELQLQVAAGEPLGLLQEDIALRGHAIEVRLYAEDPADDFLPCTGRVAQFTYPEQEGVRIDSGIAQGQEISPFYDPMVAKIITTGGGREEARRLMVKALKETAFFGLRSNRDFLIACLEAEPFAAGHFTTAFIEEQFPEGYAPDVLGVETLAMLGVGHYLLDFESAAAKALHPPAALVGFSSGQNFRTPFKLMTGEMTCDVTVCQTSINGFAVTVDGEDVGVTVQSIELLEAGKAWRFVFAAGQKSAICHMRLEDGELQASLDGIHVTAVNLLRRDPAAAEAGGGGRIEAPMHGRVIEVFVQSGDAVSKGDRLAVIEAMKMQHEILAQIDGTVTEVTAQAEQQLGAGDVMMVIQPDQEEGA
ncbi:MAG: acetyl-CoA carboxylase biotin carboxylase subunit [Parvibaculales bacterium]